MAPLAHKIRQISTIVMAPSAHKIQQNASKKLKNWTKKKDNRDGFLSKKFKQKRLEKIEKSRKQKKDNRIAPSAKKIKQKRLEKIEKSPKQKKRQSRWLPQQKNQAKTPRKD
jgi:hypothetical protein